jgi:hypothetical protein
MFNQKNLAMSHQIIGVILKSPRRGDLEGLFAYIAALKFWYD